MRLASHRYGDANDETQWAITGLLHDADYDRWPEKHPQLIVAWLREQDEPAIAQAVVAHFNPADVPELTSLDKGLLACDELAGFVMACCMVRPDGIHSLTPSSVKKKLKDKSFAAKVSRTDVYQGAERLGVNLDDHIGLVIEALDPARRHSRNRGYRALLNVPELSELHMNQSKNIYASLGVKTLINAQGTYTALGGSLMPPEVLQAMTEAAGWFVSIEELQEKVGQQIAGLLKVPVRDGHSRRSLGDHGRHRRLHGPR